MKSVLKVLTLLAVCGAGQELYAQTEQDVARYGFTPLTGSARYIGMGGAFNALGGDISSISSNPASTAVFLSNEFAISLGLNSYGTTTNYLDKNADNLEPRLVIPAFGIISSNQLKNASGKWKAVNFGYSYNRIKDFNQSTIFRGESRSSYADQLVDYSNGLDYRDRFADPFSAMTTGIGWETYLLDTLPGTTDQYYTLLDTGVVKQNYTNTTKGKIGENIISFGANYDNRLYIGAAIGITGVNFASQDVYKEETVANTPDYIHSFTYQYNLATQGTGYNFKIGGIYRITETLRMGLSYTTPTTFRMSESYSAYTENDLAEDNSYQSDEYVQSYNMIIPAKIGFGAAYLFGKRGLISFDFNHQNFANAKYKNQTSFNNQQSSDYTANNNFITKYLGPTNQIKIGGEYKIERLSLRAGIGYMDSPYKQAERLNATSATSLSLGLGYNFDNVSLDFGLSNTTYKDDYFLYPNAQPATVTNSLLAINAGIVIRY